MLAASVLSDPDDYAIRCIAYAWMRACSLSPVGARLREDVREGARTPAYTDERQFSFQFLNT